MRASHQKGKQTGSSSSNRKQGSSIEQEQATNQDNQGKFKWAHIIVSIPSNKINKSSITYNFIARNISWLKSCIILVKQYRQENQISQKLKKLQKKFVSAFNQRQLETNIQSMESGNQFILITTEALTNLYLKNQLPLNVNFLIFQNFPEKFQMLNKNYQAQLTQANKYSGVVLLFLNQYSSSTKQRQIIKTNQSWFKFSQYKIKENSDFIIRQHFKKIVKKQQLQEQTKSKIAQKQQNITGGNKQQQTKIQSKQQKGQNNNQKLKQQQQQQSKQQQGKGKENGKMEQKVGQYNISQFVTKDTMQEMQGPDRIRKQTNFLQVAVDETGRAHTLLRLINTNSNKLYKVVVYLKDLASVQFFRQNLQQNLISNSLFVTSLFDATQVQKKFQQGKFRIFAIIGNIYDDYIKNSFVPQDVNLIINEAYPKQAQQFSRRINKQPGKDKHGLIVVNLIPTINQAKHKSQYESLTSYCKQNSIKMANYNPETQNYILQCLGDTQPKQEQLSQGKKDKQNQKKEHTQQNDKQAVKSQQKYNQDTVIYNKKNTIQQIRLQQNKIQSVSSSQAQKQEKHEDAEQDKIKQQQQNKKLSEGQSPEKHEQNDKTKKKSQTSLNDQNRVEGGNYNLAGDTSEFKIMQQNNTANPALQKDQQVQTTQCKQDNLKLSNHLELKSPQKFKQQKLENSKQIENGQLGLKEQPDFRLIVEQQLQKSSRDLQTKIADCIKIHKPNLDYITKILEENSKAEKENKESIVQSICTSSSNVTEAFKKQIQTASSSSIDQINGKLKQHNDQMKKEIKNQGELTNGKIDGVEKGLNTKMDAQINAIQQQNQKTLELINIKKQNEKLTSQNSLKILNQVQNGESKNENRLISLQAKIAETDKKKSNQLTAFGNKITELEKRLKSERSKLQTEANEKNRLVAQKNSTQQKLRKTQQEKSRIQQQNKKLAQFKSMYEDNIGIWTTNVAQKQKECTKLKNQLAQKGVSLNYATSNYQKVSNELRSAKQMIVQYLKSLRPKQPTEKQTTITGRAFIGGSQKFQNLLQQPMSVQEQVMKAQLKQTIGKHFIQQKKQLRALGFETFAFQLSQMNAKMKNSKTFISDLQSYKSIKNKGTSLKSKFNKLVVESLVKIVQENERIRYNLVIIQGEKDNLQKKIRNLNDKIAETRKSGKEVILQKSVDSTNSSFQNISKNINQMMTQIKMGQRESKKLSEQLQSAVIKISSLEEEKRLLQLNKQKQQSRLKQEIDKITKQKQEINRIKQQLQVKNRSIQQTLNQKSLLLQSTQKKLGETQKDFKDLQIKHSTLQRDYKDKSDESKGYKERLQSKKQQLRIKCDQFEIQKQRMTKGHEDKRKQLQQKCKRQVRAIEIQESQKRQKMRKQNEFKLNDQFNKQKMLQNKTQQFQKGVNSSINKSLKVELNITLDNFGQSLLNLESSIALKLSKMSFLVESELYNGYNDSEKEFVFNAVAKVVSTRVVATKTLFEGFQGCSWDQWLFKVRKRPNILMLMTLQNGHKICCFSENPFANEEFKTGSGFMSSITNRKVYPLKNSHQGKAATYDQYMFCFGRNELMIKANCTFSIILSRVFCHFQTNDVPNSEFIGQEDDEGDYKRVEFHQMFLEGR